MEKSSRGLASASEETRRQVAQCGGLSPHKCRGLQAADKSTRHKVAVLGGLAPHKNRSKLLELVTDERY